MAQTKDLLEIEKAGFRWAVRCFDYYFTREELEFFALRYKPFYESMQEIQAGKGAIADFDPWVQHKQCRILFDPAFSQHGARMLSPAAFSMTYIEFGPETKKLVKSPTCELALYLPWRNL